MSTVNLVMTPESMEAFLKSQRDKGVSERAVGRLKTALRMLFEFLPEDKVLTREKLAEWRADMNGKGYAFQTVQNYVKRINLYLDYAGCSELRFRRGKQKDITGMCFGYLTAIEPTEKRERRDVVWLCRCKCGKEVEVPATRLILNNTLSCGCIQKETIKRAKKYFEGTSLEQSLKDQIVSTRSTSGYVGVSKKGDRWQAYINYKKRRISLGVYSKLEDAVKARARGKEEVMADAAVLLKSYEAIHAHDALLPGKSTAPKQAVLCEPKTIHAKPLTAAKRTDNTSGYTGVSFRKNGWEARICHNKVRYTLGCFERPEEAVEARRTAEELLKKDPAEFEKTYAKPCKRSAV